jgi:hypothetical protein
MRLLYLLVFVVTAAGTIYGTINHHHPLRAVPADATAICQDGAYGFGDRAGGACAAHGGVRWRR